MPRRGTSGTAPPPCLIVRHVPSGNRRLHIADDRTTTWSYDGDETIMTGPDPTDSVTDVYFNGDNVPTEIVKGYGTDAQATTYMSYDPSLNTERVKDGNGNTTTYTYDPNGNVLTKVDPLNRKTVWTYDDQNDMTSMTPPYGPETTYAYSSGKLTEVSRPIVETGLNQDTEYSYTDDSDPGAVTEVTDSDSNDTDYGYNDHGDLTSVTDADGNKTTYAYDTDNRRDVDDDRKWQRSSRQLGRGH